MGLRGFIEVPLTGADDDSLLGMPRSFDFSVESPVSVEQIHGAFCSEDYWVERLAAYGGNGRLDSFEADEDGAVRLVIVHDLRNALLPKPLGRLYPRDLEIVQDETWNLVRDVGVRGELRTEARGIPGSGVGTVVMAPADDGSRLKCSGTVKFKVPLVGGTIESLLSRQMVDETPEMLRFTTKWIEENA
jgi:uncharacterized protein DUF2505